MNAQNNYPITLQVIKEQFAVCRLSPKEPIPNWVQLDSDYFSSITKTKDELSIVCLQAWVPENIKAEKNWRMFKIKGHLDFALVGILKRVITPLSENGISIYAISTFDTDYVLVKESEFERAMELLGEVFGVES